MFQKQPREVLYKKWSWKFRKIYTWVGVSFLIKLQVSGLQLKTPTQSFYGKFWENFRNIFCIKHQWVGVSEWLPSSK